MSAARRWRRCLRASIVLAAVTLLGPVASAAPVRGSSKAAIAVDIAGAPDPVPPGDLQTLDDFADPSAWTLSATDDVKASLRSGPAVDGRRSLCIEVDFGRVTGYVALRRRLALDLPPRYTFEVGLQGSGPPNDLQFKLLDAGGENVWWGRRLDAPFPADAATWRLRQRDIGFAWGPTADRTLRRVDAVEFVVASGRRGGGQASVCFDRLALRTLPAVEPTLPAPKLGDDGSNVDFGVPRAFDALVLHWRGGWGPVGYAIELSDDGQRWRTVQRIDRASGPLAVHPLPGSEARFVRIVSNAPGDPATLAGIEPRETATIDGLIADLARASPRGRYPRAWLGEQPYWTVFGVDGGPVAALIGEDGAVEPRPGIGSLEPFLIADGRVLGWADARIRQTLRDDALPMPSVLWDLGDARSAASPAAAAPSAAATPAAVPPAGDRLVLAIDAFATGASDAPQAIVRYTVRNLARERRTVELALVWRPLQVNPPTQFLAHPGGAVEIGTLGWDGHTLAVDGRPAMRPLVTPAEVRLEPFAAGSAVDRLAGPRGSVSHDPTAASRLSDPERHPSGVFRFPLTIGPGASRSVVVAMPIAGDPAPPAAGTVDAEADRVAAAWHGKLDRFRLRGPPPVADLGRDVRAALGQILVNRSGPAIQPGARAYARSWIRDGALTSAALLRLGRADEVRAFIDWYAGFQFANGKVPCCATARGADPVPENDSDGEFAFLVDAYLRSTGDLDTARRRWPNVRAAIAHLETLRQSERTDRNRTSDRAAFFGLLPPSISHEGYSDRPAYAYWDDIWGSIGYRSAAALADALGETADAARIRAQGAEFDADLVRSIDAATRRHRLDLLPGSADRGDVDPTSSTIALSPGGLDRRLPATLVEATFARWWLDFQGRRADEAAGVRHGDGAYTPYEWRNVGALLRLGERDRARSAVAYFRADRRPAGWRQWAEVVARNPREARFLGDMPHGWVASDQIRAVLDLWAYEDDATGGLVLAAGMSLDDLGGPGVRVDGLGTPWGIVGWRARMRRVGAEHRVVFVWPGLAKAPPGGIAVRGPWPDDARVSVDGRAVGPRADVVRLTTRRAVVRIAW